MVGETTRKKLTGTLNRLRSLFKLNIFLVNMSSLVSARSRIPTKRLCACLICHRMRVCVCVLCLSVDERKRENDRMHFSRYQNRECTEQSSNFTYTERNGLWIKRWSKHVDAPKCILYDRSHSVRPLSECELWKFVRKATCVLTIPNVYTHTRFTYEMSIE